MGKKMYNDEVDQENGWFRGFMYALLHKNRHAKGIVNPQQRSLILGDFDEHHQLLADSESHLHVNKRSKANKKSLKARIKSLIIKQVSKQQNGKKQKSTSSPKPQAKTNSIHHVEPSDDELSETGKDKKRSILYVSSTFDNANKSDEDVLEIFQVNKDLFFQFVENVDDSNRKPFHSLPYFSAKKGLLTKSGSYPSADLSRQKNFKPSTLEHKKNEIWHQLPDLALIKCRKYLTGKSVRNDSSTVDQNSSPDNQQREENHDEMVHPSEPDGNFLSEVVITHRRSFSGTESLDRYTRLYENSSRHEVKLHPSKSLKLRNEYDLPSGAQISLRRIRSLTHLDFWYPFQNENPLEAVTEDSSVIQENVEDEEIPTTAPKTAECLQVNLIEKVDDSKMDCYREEDTKDSETGGERVSLSFLDTNNSDMYYVKEILERSRISSNSIDQPMDVSVFDEMEVYWHQKFESTEEDMYGCSHHQHLFDLINEELVEIYDRSLTYYPKALSSSCRIRPITAEHRIVDEVVSRISRLLDRKPAGYQTLNNIVSQDLSKDDDWMNVQVESECEALVLEDIIMDELLEEILCF